MPWSNQNGGKGPWGGGSENGPRPAGGKSEENRQRPRKPAGGGRSTPPDMDDLLRKGRQQLKQFGNGGIFLLVGLFVVAFWLFQCFYTVQPGEQAVVLRFGEPQQNIAKNGLHFRLWPIDTYRKVQSTEQIASIGVRGAESGLMLSADQNIVNVSFSVYYNIVDPAAWLFNARDPRGTIDQVAESAMREVVGRSKVDDVYRNELQDIGDEVQKIIQTTLDKYRIGVQVDRIAITKPEPPAEVRDAFEDKQTAEQESATSQRDGGREQKRVLGLAAGEAAHIREDAAAYKTRVIEEARGEALRFTAMAKEAESAPQAVRYRLYLETIEEFLSAPNKLVLDKATGTVNYLPLQDLLGKGNAAAGAKGK